MDALARRWTRYQWVGETPTGDAFTSDRSVDQTTVRDQLNIEWNLSQWPAERSSGERRAWLPAVVLDTAGGFSGFGHADSGGQRWASVDRPSPREKVAAPLVTTARHAA